MDVEPKDMTVRYGTQSVGEVEVFYREARPAGAPVLLCVFRRKPAGDSDPFQPVIPTQTSHP